MTNEELLKTLIDSQLSTDEILAELACKIEPQNTPIAT